MKWVKTLFNQWRQSAPISKIVIAILCLSLVPIAIYVVNRTFADFTFNRGPYQGMPQIVRVSQGKQIYVPFTAEYVPITYTPLYYWVSGILCRIFGVSMVLPRLVSVVSSIIFAGFIAAFVWKNTERNLMLSFAAPVIVLLALSFYFSTWMTYIHPDALHFALVLCGFYLLSLKGTMVQTVMAAVALSCGMLTKQTGLAYVAAGALLAFLKSFRTGMLFSLISVGLLAGVLGWVNYSSDGEFFRSVLSEKVLLHRIESDVPLWNISRFLTEVIQHFFLGLFGIMGVMALVPLIRGDVRKWFSVLLKPEYVMCGSGLAVAFIAWPNPGSGHTHGLIGAAGLVICGLVGLHKLANDLPSPFNTRCVACVVLVQLVLVLIPFIKDYRIGMIDKFDRQRYKQISNVFRAGTTVFYQFPYLPRVFGQPSSGHYGDDTCLWANGRYGDYSKKPAFLIDPFRNQDFDYFIMSFFSDRADPVIQAVLENYIPIAQLPRHPTQQHGGEMRHPLLILKAKRLFPPSVNPQ